MKFRTTLLASAAVMFAAGTVSAADLTGPFYMPGEGKFTSDTRVEYSRIEYKNDKSKNDAWEAAEEVAYGVTDNMTVFGTLYNEFDTEGEYNNDHNFGYEVGAAYNMREGNFLAQVSGSYYTYNPKDLYGRHHDERWQKYLNGEIRLGYDMGDGLTPYMVYGVEGQLDQADRYMDQYVFAGVHKYAENWAVDAGILYDFVTDGENENIVSAQAEFDYYPVENVALGVYGSYYLAGADNVIDKDYTTGVRVKVAF